MIVTCRCGATNRVPNQIPGGKTVRCGACHHDLAGRIVIAKATEKAARYDLIEEFARLFLGRKA